MTMTAQHLPETEVSSDGTHSSQQADTPPATTGPPDHPKSGMTAGPAAPSGRSGAKTLLTDVGAAAR
jgi:hypothetical protein